jgi:outer membrane protein assembly factor BamB
MKSYQACWGVIVAGWLVGSVAAGAAQPKPYQPPKQVPIAGIGQRGDGSGIFPADKPPTSFDEATGRNIRWRIPLPNWGYGAPVPVGNRVLFLADADARFIWPVLYCFDADTGQQVWSAKVNPLDAFPDLPAAERQRVSGIVQRYWDDNRALFTAMMPLRALGQADVENPLLQEANRQVAERGLKIEKYNRGYGLLRYVSYPKDYERDKREIWQKYNIQPNLSNQGAGRTGDAFGTPVSDGVNVYAITIQGTCTAFDIATGKRVWTRSIGGGQYRQANHYMTSPRLYQDLVIAYYGDTNAGMSDIVVAYDRRTGEERWRHKGSAKGRSDVQGSRPGASPFVVSINGVDVALFGCGWAIRLPDGHLYEESIGTAVVPWAWNPKEQALFTCTSRDGASDRYRLDLAIVNGQLKGTPRWAIANSISGFITLFHSGWVYSHSGYQYDPATGFPRGEGVVLTGEPLRDPHQIYRGDWAKTLVRSVRSKQFLLLANGHIYGLEECSGGKKGEDTAAGVLEVFTVGGQKVSENRLPQPQTPEHLARQGFPNTTSHTPAR